MFVLREHPFSLPKWCYMPFKSKNVAGGCYLIQPSHFHIFGVFVLSLGYDAKHQLWRCWRFPFFFFFQVSFFLQKKKKSPLLLHIYKPKLALPISCSKNSVSSQIIWLALTKPPELASCPPFFEMEWREMKQIGDWWDPVGIAGTVSNFNLLGFYWQRNCKVLKAYFIHIFFWLMKSLMVAK